MKRYKSRGSGNDNDNDGTQRKSEYQQNDEVTFGNGFNRSSYDRSSGSITGAGVLPDRHKNLNRNMSLNGLGNEEQGIIKSNPLLKHYPNLSDNSGFISDMSNSNSECGEEHITHELLKNVTFHLNFFNIFLWKILKLIFIFHSCYFFADAKCKS